MQGSEPALERVGVQIHYRSRGDAKRTPQQLQKLAMAQQLEEGLLGTASPLVIAQDFKAGPDLAHKLVPHPRATPTGIRLRTIIL